MSSGQLQEESGRPPKVKTDAAGTPEFRQRTPPAIAALFKELRLPTQHGQQEALYHLLRVAMGDRAFLNLNKLSVATKLNVPAQLCFGLCAGAYLQGADPFSRPVTITLSTFRCFVWVTRLHTDGVVLPPQLCPYFMRTCHPINTLSREVALCAIQFYADVRNSDNSRTSHHITFYRPDMTRIVRSLERISSDLGVNEHLAGLIVCSAAGNVDSCGNWGLCCQLVHSQDTNGSTPTWQWYRKKGWFAACVALSRAKSQANFFDPAGYPPTATAGTLTSTCSATSCCPSFCRKAKPCETMPTT